MNAHAPSEPQAGDLDRLRAEIERIDRALIDLIRDRVGVARSIADVKRAGGLPALDPGQEAAVVRRAAVLARDAGLPAEDVRELFWCLIGLARRAERDR